MVNDERGAAQRCLQLHEINYQIASYLFEPEDLYNACRCSRLWYDSLLPLRAAFPHVHLTHVQSFLEFLKRNEHVVRHCHGLRILADDLDGGMDLDNEVQISTGVDNSAFISATLDYLAEKGRLEFFMYALPGEPRASLNKDVWRSLAKSSPTLMGIYVELAAEHWSLFLSSTFENLRYLRLFLDDDGDPHHADGLSERNAELVAFLQRHASLEVLHLYLGVRFADLDFSRVRLPALRSLLLISKAPGTQLRPFLLRHPHIESLDLYVDADIDPFTPDALPALGMLQVSSLTAKWFAHIFDAAGEDARTASTSNAGLLPTTNANNDADAPAVATRPPRRAPLRHVQVTAADENSYLAIERTIAPVGAALRCLELIFWTRDVHLLRVCADACALFPQLRELSLFIPSWSAQEGEGSGKVYTLGDYLGCFAANTTLLALGIADPLAGFIEAEDIEAEAGRIPPALRFVVWRSQTFRISRHANEAGANADVDVDSGAGEDAYGIHVERTHHPRTLRGSRYLRDWHEEMVYDHVRGDYDI